MDFTSKQLETPCYILDKVELERSIKGFQEALKKEFGNTIVGYSVKTNSLPYCVSYAYQLGCFAEVVSYDEYNLALACGIPVNRIIYNGPMKSKESFLEALTLGAIVNVETHRELMWLSELPKDGDYKVGVRLNVNISRVSPADADGDDDNSRFGFSDQTDEFKKALSFLSKLSSVKLSGLHIHRTAHSRSIRFYKHSIQYACEVIKKYHLKLDYLDVGGGYFGIFPNKPTYQEYALAFKEVLERNQLEKLTVIIEPGNALVASCFSFLSEVIDVKHVEKDKWFVTTDGSRNDIDPFFRKSGYLTDIVRNGKAEVVREQIISGCTCLEYDRLFTLHETQLLQEGDRIVYKNVGAYTMCLSPLFIRYIPNVYMVDNGNYTLIREKWTEKEYIFKSKINNG